jgi:hypothetical protein
MFSSSSHELGLSTIPALSVFDLLPPYPAFPSTALFRVLFNKRPVEISTW